ncbi:MAG TPA: hypothetical protein VHX63_02750 [Acidobacteriaceae bacterium]|jgi:hypothetical protein|nr:hypothetical protein [Acidobacteriaceae bacterium]
MNPMLAHRNHSTLGTGLRLLQQNKRLLLWVYLANLLTGLLPALAYHRQVSGILDHSFAAQRIAGRLDLSYLIELLQHTTKNGMGVYALFSLLALGYCVFSFILAAGIYYVFATGERPTLAVVERSGIEYFWRFVRITLFALLISLPTLGILAVLRNVLLKHADNVYVGRSFFFISMGTFAIVAIVAVFLRFWFDIAEAYVVQLGENGDRRVRRSVIPAWRLLWERFFSNYVSYLFIGILGWLGFSFFLWFWAVGVPPRLVGLAWVVGQLAIVCLLFARIWQRGMATAIVYSAPASEPFVAASYPVVPTLGPTSVIPEDHPQDAPQDAAEPPAAANSIDPASQAG